MRRLSEGEALAVQEVIETNRGRLLKPGVLGLEPGFPIVNGRLLREPAIIAYVGRKRQLAQILEEDRLPRTVGGYRVDVLEVGPWTALELSGEAGVLQEREMAAASGATYVGIDGDPIDGAFTINKPILCHAGPDAGWPVLQRFLAETRDTLTVAMYDFSADYIVDALIAAARVGEFSVELTLDDHVDDTEEALQERLRMKLSGRYSSTIIRCGSDRRFPTAYHPKVAVQDGRRFWLSSGNWSPRSQPGVDPIGDPASARGLFSRANREWHVVVDDEPLAKLFERYILHDKAQAEEDAALADQGSLARLPDLFVPLDALMAELQDAALAVTLPTAPASLPAPGKEFTVRPLLSPDNYARRIEEWIRGATKSLWLQYSYITYSAKPIDTGFRAVLDHLGELSWRDDFDLRIIVGSNDREKVRKLAENGFNEAKIKVQSNVHNKAIVRDGTQVLVSSQNWSGDGFLRNRDAGLIIEDEDVAAYFREILGDDWEMRARDPFAGAALSAMIAEEGTAPPPGMVRMAWADFFGE